MRVSQFLMIVPVLLQAVLTLAVSAFYWHRQMTGAVGDRLASTYRAQFDLPVLFYAGSLFAYAMRIVDVRILIFATLFALAQSIGVASGLRLDSGKGQAVANLASVLAVAGLWAMIALHFFHSGF